MHTIFNKFSSDFFTSFLLKGDRRMFYDIFEKLCKENNTSPFACCKEIGLSGGTAAYWKRSGKSPKLETLEKIAEHFNVSVDYLRGIKENAPVLHEDVPEPLIIKATAVEWGIILERMSDESLDMLQDYAEYLLYRQSRAVQEEK